MFTTACHLSLSSASSIQSTHTQNYFLKILFSIILLIQLVLLSGLFPSGFPTITLYKPLLSPKPTMYPSHFLLLDLITRRFCDTYRLWISTPCSLLQSAVTLSLLSPNIFLSTLLSNTFSLSSLGVTDQDLKVKQCMTQQTVNSIVQSW